jgi:shikimate kinase
MSPTEPTRRVFLIGFMGAGKTSVGQALARRLGYAFLDLDEVIERRQQRSVAAIFAEHGEAAFRRMESAALQEILEAGTASRGDEGSGNGLIVASGGGAFAQPENWRALERAGAISVLLDAPLKELRRRCENDPKARPLARDEQMFAQLYEQRRGAYEQARFRADTMGKSVEEVAAEIELMIMARVKPEV